MKNPRDRRPFAFLFALALVICPLSPLPASSSETPHPPEQPEQGPGGKEYAHASVRKSVFGQGSEECWIFEPDEPRPEAAPLIVFLHGWGAMDPKLYGAWLDHLVRRGNIVVFPRYQSGIASSPKTFTQNTVRALRTAQERFENGGYLRPDPEKVAFVGHSMGGLLSANLAALARSEELPLPKAVFAVQAGLTESNSLFEILPLEDLSSIPRGVLLIAMASDSDTVTGEYDTKRIYRESSEIPAADKCFLLLRSDPHGLPPLSADHMAPCGDDSRFSRDRAYVREDRPRPDAGRRGVDALDYYGLWKTFDLLCERAFAEKRADGSVGEMAQLTEMGAWSDGQAVAEMFVLEVR